MNGRQNAVIIDADADLDEAIVDCTYSAFGYQGPKMFRAIPPDLLEENYDRVMERLLKAAASVRVEIRKNRGSLSVQ